MEEDELDKEWTASRYLEFDGYHEPQDVQRYLAARTPDEQGRAVQMAFGAVIEREDGDVPMEDIDDDEEGDVDTDAVPLYRMQLEDFKDRLIENFDILWEKQQIRWPSRSGGDPPTGMEDRLFGTNLS